MKRTQHGGGAPHGVSTLVLACVAATWIVWGSTYLAIRFALVSFPPFLQMGTRFLTAAGILLVWNRLRGYPLPTAAQWRNAAIIGALMLGGGMGGTAYAEQTVASGLVVAFIAVTPASIALMNLFFGIRPSRLEVAGMFIGLAGVLLLVRGAGFSASPGGLVAVAAGNVAWALGSVLSQRRFPLAPGTVGFASEMLCGGLFLMLLSQLAGEHARWPPEPRALLAWIYLVTFGSLIAFSAYMVLLARTRPAVAASYSLVNPVIGMLLGVTLGGEQVTAHEWWALLVILCGVILLLSGKLLIASVPRAGTAP
ncbi:MAG: EamA family transporter [Proteobacteria bacterium]|nr:EamA family transporter [Pseudomonadota bacterium]